LRASAHKTRKRFSCCWLAVGLRLGAASPHLRGNLGGAA
jgi:hypothetical protein